MCEISFPLKEFTNLMIDRSIQNGRERLVGKHLKLRVGTFRVRSFGSPSWYPKKQAYIFSRKITLFVMLFFLCQYFHIILECI